MGAEQSGFINEMGFETYQKLMQEAWKNYKMKMIFKIYLKMKTIVRNYSNLQKEVIFDTDFN